MESDVSMEGSGAGTAMPPPPKKTLMPVAGGALLLVAGLLAITMGVLWIDLDAAEIRDSGIPIPEDITDEDLENTTAICVSLSLVFGIVAIAGGALGLMRKHFALCIVGGIFGILGIGFGLGAVLAIVGLILVALSRNEFQ